MPPKKRKVVRRKKQTVGQKRVVLAYKRSARSRAYLKNVGRTPDSQLVRLPRDVQMMISDLVDRMPDQMGRKTVRGSELLRVDANPRIKMGNTQLKERVRNNSMRSLRELERDSRDPYYDAKPWMGISSVGNRHAQEAQLEYIRGQEQMQKRAGVFISAVRLRQKKARRKARKQPRPTRKATLAAAKKRKAPTIRPYDWYRDG